MPEFSVHDLLKDTILGLLDNNGIATFVLYEEVAQSLSDLAFSFDQFIDAVGCLKENNLVDMKDIDGIVELSLVEDKTQTRLDVN